LRINRDKLCGRCPPGPLERVGRQAKATSLSTAGRACWLASGKRPGATSRGHCNLAETAFQKHRGKRPRSTRARHLKWINRCVIFLAGFAVGSWTAVGFFLAWKAPVRSCTACARAGSQGGHERARKGNTVGYREINAASRGAKSPIAGAGEWHEPFLGQNAACHPPPCHLWRVSR